MAKKAYNTWTKRVKGLQKPAAIAEYAGQKFPILGSKTASQKAIANGRIWLNNKPAKLSDFVKNGDLIKLRGTGVKKAKVFEAPMDIVFEDDFLVIVNKPGGIAVNGDRNKTVENALARVAKRSRQEDALPHPVAVHRIDVPTKGLVMLAKTKSALIKMGKAFQQNQVKKEYFAVVHGKTPKVGQIDLPIQQKQASTKFETQMVVRSTVFGHLALLKLLPITGRTHQLRIHLQKRGHLIVGDKMYAAQQKTILGKGLFLCACRLLFAHPESGKSIDIQISPPARFQKLLEREQARFG